MAKAVFCLGIAPALQRTMLFNVLEMGEVNRALAVDVSAAGKAVNTAQALALLGERATVAGFNGGETGRMVAKLVAARQVKCVFTPMAASTRVCTTLIEQGYRVVTELVEEAPDPGPEAWLAFADTARGQIARASMLVISGTLPPGVPDDFYRPFVVAAHEAGIPVIIDSHRAALLSVLPEKPLVAKLNVRELEKTLGKRCGSVRAITAGARDLQRLGAQSVLVTQGSGTAVWVSGKEVLLFEPQTVDPLNPIGSGDCVTAGLARALLLRLPVADSVAFALGCGTANALTATPANFDRDKAMDLRARLVVRKA